ncbi:MAG: Smr/MutS family protein [Acidobacteria bacterium]|nr:Smr/MutS family protein [Acidobacteriota bacterium]MCA1627424.1 Smr/MutS family protein [Acidobacteriota bacterium]
MNDQAFTTLEYQQLLALIRRNAQTEAGQARAERLTPATSTEQLRHELAALAECVLLRGRGVNWSFSGFTDPAETIGRLRVEGATLDPLAILQTAKLCEQAMSARAAILAERENAPVLWQLVDNLPRDLNSLVARISNKILPTGELDDRASPELAQIRHDISALRSRITRSLEGLMRRSAEAIQDELVTIRNDRFVIPVKADHRGRVQGVAHGYSSSGATAFVEPLETIDANNELQGLHEAEAREIAKILFRLTEELRVQLPAIEMAAEAVAELDFINAKAVFHRQFDCSIPQVGADTKLDLVEARHPLLEENLRASGGAVVPVSFALDDEKKAMIISGANAGGKTVVLKTTGLLALMALSGISVPAKSARFPFYASVLADIGDHQSLAANLSTFTSHVANIARMLELCEAPALVLLDEVGTGTDPEEGSALGVAVVDHFRRVCGAHVIATTHYSGLKMYAGNDPGVLNASVEFNEKTLRPTYRLIVGLAGASSGLEIAQRFGVPKMIVDAAVSSVKESSLQASEYLRRIKREAEEAESLRVALEEERTAVAEKFASLDKEAANRERKRQTAFEQMAQRTVAELEKRARELVGRIEDRTEKIRAEREAQRQVAEMKRAAQSAAKAVAPAQSEVDSGRGIRIVRDGQVVPAAGSQREHAQEDVVEYVTAAPREIVAGDKVKLLSFGSVGVVDKIKDGYAEVRVKALRFREKLVNLELVEQQSTPKRQPGKLEKLRRSSGTEVHLAEVDQNVGSELNVIGRTTDEAVDAVDKFLDEASLASLSQVRIVHGHGTGALRRAIAALLSDHPHVARFVAAPPDQGGTGATLVELRQ